MIWYIPWYVPNTQHSLSSISIALPLGPRSRVSMRKSNKKVYRQVGSSLHLSPLFPLSIQSHWPEPLCCPSLQQVHHWLLGKPMVSTVEHNNPQHRLYSPTSLTDEGWNNKTCTHVCLVAQLCPTLCDLMDCSLPGSSVREILQARILEWVAIPFSRGSSQLRDRTQVSGTAGRSFTIWVINPRIILSPAHH